MKLSNFKFPFVVVLKNRSTRQFNAFGILLNLISSVFFISEFLVADQLNFFLLAGILLVIGLVIWNIYRSFKGRKVFYDRAYLITALLWIKMPYMEWLFIVFILLALLDHQVKFPLEIGFSERQIVFNSLFKKRYNWSQLSNVMLKDGLLTMDFHNNRLLQREIEDDEDEDDATEEEFNNFCQEQLRKKDPGSL